MRAGCCPCQRCSPHLASQALRPVNGQTFGGAQTAVCCYIRYVVRNSKGRSLGVDIDSTSSDRKAVKFGVLMRLGPRSRSLDSIHPPNPPKMNPVGRAFSGGSTAGPLAIVHFGSVGRLCRVVFLSDLKPPRRVLDSAHLDHTAKQHWVDRHAPYGPVPVPKSSPPRWAEWHLDRSRSSKERVEASPAR